MTIKASWVKPDPQQMRDEFVLGSQACARCGKRNPHTHDDGPDNEPDGDADDAAFTRRHG